LRYWPIARFGVGRGARKKLSALEATMDPASLTEWHELREAMSRDAIRISGITSVALGSALLAALIIKYASVTPLKVILGGTVLVPLVGLMVALRISASFSPDLLKRCDDFVRAIHLRDLMLTEDPLAPFDTLPSRRTPQRSRQTPIPEVPGDTR
jgi:hypothetical protein